MIINYLITSVNANREKDISPDTQVGIANNINITSLEKDDRFKIIKFFFKFEASFSASSKEIGKIMIEGMIVYTGDNLDKIYKSWEESKKLEPSVTEEILQASLNISILEAMSIAKMLQLPSILPLPKVTSSNEGAEEQKQEKKKKQ